MRKTQLQEHVDEKHPKSSFPLCFPSYETDMASFQAAAAAPPKAKAKAKKK
jgi:hypothetical protein